MGRRQIKIAIAAVLGMLGVAFAAAPASAQAIEVMMNQAKIVKLGRAADTIIIGNPLIADASVQDASTIVLTGKGFGVTNVVVMDTSGNVVMDEQVVVSRHVANSVRIYRRTQVQTLSCSPYCESAYKNDAEQISEASLNTGN